MCVCESGNHLTLFTIHNLKSSMAPTHSVAFCFKDTAAEVGRESHGFVESHRGEGGGGMRKHVRLLKDAVGLCPSSSPRPPPCAARGSAASPPGSG